MRQQERSGSPPEPRIYPTNGPVPRRRSSGALAVYLQGDIDQSTNSLGARRLILLPVSPMVEPP
jgi:hypothetical protein